MLYIFQFFLDVDGDDDFHDFYTLSYDNLGSKRIYYYLDDNAKLRQFLLNITGIESGFSYSENFFVDTYMDEILTTTRKRCGAVIPQVKNIQNFLIDAFNDSSVNATIWEKTPDASHNVGAGESGYDWILANTETTSLNLHMEFNEDIDPGIDDDISINMDNYLILRPDQFQVSSAENFNFTVSYLSHGHELNSEDDCNVENELFLGNVLIWESELEDCSDTDSSCHHYASSDSLNFKFESNDTGFIMTINGTERIYGDDAICGNYNYYKYWDWSNWSLTFSDSDPECIAREDSGTLDNQKYYQNFDILYNEPFVYHGEADGDYSEDLGTCSGTGIICINPGCTEGIYCSAAGSDFICGGGPYGYYSGTCSYDAETPSQRGCDDVDSDFYFYNVSVDKGVPINSSYFSTSVFDSAVDVSILNFNASGDATIFAYVSTDNGDNYQNIIDNQSTPITNPGKNVKYYFVFNFTNDTYPIEFPFIDEVDISAAQSYPNNLTFDFGGDGVVDATLDGEVNTTYQINLSGADLSNVFTSDKGTFVPHSYQLPLIITSDSAGAINISNSNLTYDPNPVFLDVTTIQENIYSSLLQTFINLTTQLIQNYSGNILSLFGLKIHYLGGNYTLPILAHNDDYSKTEQINITYHFSQWDYAWVPSGVEWIYFDPTNQNATNVTPYGQTEEVPLFNLTNLGYGGRNATLSFYVNDTSDCVNTTISLTENKSDGQLVSDSWVEFTNMSYLETVNISMWADYACSNDDFWFVYNPFLHPRLCVDGGLCSEDVI